VAMTTTDVPTTPSEKVNKVIYVITQDDMKALYSRVEKSNDPIGARQYCVYLFSFLVMLRIKEVLSLKFTDVKYSENYITLTLRLRKDAHGKFMSFVLHPNDEQQFLCPVRAYLRWLGIRDSAQGPLFLNDKQGVLIIGEALSYDGFRHHLEDELQQLKIRNGDFYDDDYSFGRGGFQFHLRICGKTLREIYLFSGWSVKSAVFSNMVKTNDEKISWEDFTRPQKETGLCFDCRSK